MEDGALKHLRDIRRINTRLRFRRRRREADLIINNDVEGAADHVCVELAEIQRLLNHTLTRKCGIAVNQNNQAAITLRIGRAILFRSHAPKSDGIHEFQMTWIEAER